MFQSTGLFRDVHCSYFQFGLCERPYCHFKHARQNEAKALEEAKLEAQNKDSKEYIPPTSSLQRTLKEIEDSIISEKRLLKISNNGGPSKSEGISNNKPTGTPEYNPTPIPELNKKKQIECASKYDLALLEGPETDSEYDPASNFSTGQKTSAKKTDNIFDESLPDYAKQFSRTKRAAERSEEGESPLAKIPKFVSVEYTPAEFSDDETMGIREDTFSDGASENDNQTEKLPESSTRQNKDLKQDDRNCLPIEFTADGFIKSVYIEKHGEKKDKIKVNKNKSRKEHDHIKNDDSKYSKSNKSPDLGSRRNSQEQKCGKSPKENKGPKTNIFNLFKEEFDNALDTCSKSKQIEPCSSPGVKLKTVSGLKRKDELLGSKDSVSRSLKHKNKKSEKAGKETTKQKLSSKDLHSSERTSQKVKDHSNSSRHKTTSAKEENHKNPSQEDRSSSSKHRESKSSSKHKDSKQSSSSNKHSRKHLSKDSISDKHSHSSPKSSEKTKKKKIVNLDVDLFGVDTDTTKDTAFDDDLSDLDKYFEDDPFGECLRIFNEENAKKSSTEVKPKNVKKSSENDNYPAVTGKKRMALKQNDPKEKVACNKPTPKPSPAQVMMNRYKVMQERILQSEQENKEKMKHKVRQMSQKNSEKATSSAGLSKSNLASASETFSEYIAGKKKRTSAVTVAKGSARKAHTPTLSIAKLKRPVIEVSTSSKVGTNVRQRYLNLFIDEFMKMYTEEEAFKKGKAEEEAVYKRCSNKNIYLNFAVNTIKRLRSEVAEKKSGVKKPSPSMKLSHAKVLNGAGASKATYTLHRSGNIAKLQEEDFKGAELYKRLQPYILTEDQLKENNFPFPDPAKGGAAVFYGEERSGQKGSTKGYEKLCLRCGKVFEVYPNGKYPIKEECVYHWGKAWKKKIAGSIETRYTCCQGDLATEGCQVAKLHVHETNKRETASGYMKTIPSSPPIDGDYGVYALDCEMVYTTMGVELARVTVVDADQEPVYESIVLPDNMVVDCNTRFSGITEEDFIDVHTSLRDVQAVLLSLFTDKTILMGHSLESDLSALKMIHKTVVDTSVVFPHRLGKPYKRALKNLMADYLKKIIQDDVAGHDSLEDAVACIQLMQYRLKEDSRTDHTLIS